MIDIRNFIKLWNAQIIMSHDLKVFGPIISNDVAYILLDCIDCNFHATCVTICGLSILNLPILNLSILNLSVLNLSIHNILQYKKRPNVIIAKSMHGHSMACIVA